MGMGAFGLLFLNYCCLVAPYNPLSDGHSGGCPTVAPATTTPVGPYLNDGTGTHTLFNVSSQGRVHYSPV